MKWTTALGLTAVGALHVLLTRRLLRERPPALKYVLGGAAFLLPFGVHALLTQGQKTTFLFISDTHGPATGNTALVNAMMQEQGVDFVVHGGDLVDGEEWWRAWWETPFAAVLQQWRVYPTLGNHDPEAGFRQRFDTVPPYKLSLPSVDLFFLPFTVTSAIAAWLDRETAASTAPYKILVTHNPLWPAVGDANNLPRLLAASLPRLSLVLAGHNHVFWDSVHNGLRQVIVKSGPKNYTCNASAQGCVNSLQGYVRVEVDSNGIDVSRRAVR